MMDQVKQTAFLITNVPEDQELLQDFLEGYLNRNVKHLEYSIITEGTALVSVDGIIDLKDIADCLQAGEDDLDDINGPIQVSDAGYCDDAVLVENLDEDFLSKEFLQLYIESTFNDGYESISGFELIQNYEKRVVLRFNDKDVIPRILEKEDQIPLSSLDYHIQVKPFYCKFYSDLTSVDNSDDEPTVDYDGHNDTSSPPLDENDSYSEPTSDKHVHNHGDTILSPPDENDSYFEPTSDKHVHNHGDTISSPPDENDSYFDPKLCQPCEPTEWSDGDNALEEDIAESDPIQEEEEDPIQEEEEVKVPKIIWKLLKSKLHQMIECKLCMSDYNKNKNVLRIVGPDVTTLKSSILDLLESVNKRSLKLSAEVEDLLRKEKVQNLIKDFYKEQNQNFIWQIEDTSLIVHSVDVVDCVDKIRERFLHTCTVELPNTDVPKNKMRECRNLCREKDYLAVISRDDHKFTITGIREDVTYASKDLNKVLEGYHWMNKSFTLKDNVAVFVKKYAIQQLEGLFDVARITKRRIEDKEICFEYKIQNVNQTKLIEDLRSFKQNIIESRVGLNKFNKEDLMIINTNLERDRDLLKHFEETNSCCIFFYDKATRNAHDEKEKRDNNSIVSKGIIKLWEVFGSKKKVESNGNIIPDTSCSLQILPSGNITTANSDMLVCGVHESLNMNKTAVSKEFHKADDSLQDRVKDYTFSPNDVFVDEMSLPGTNCKAIAFIVLKRWEQDVSDKLLNAAVTEILETANKMKLSSVSIPPLGCGRALKYPEDEATQAIVGAIDTFEKNKARGELNIKSIDLIAPGHLHEVMTKAANDLGMKIGGIEEDGHKNEIDNSQASGGEKGNVDKETLETVQAPILTIVCSNTGSIADKFKNEIKKKWLFVDYFKPGDTFCWPPQFMNDVTLTAKKMHVLVSKIKDESTKRFVCKIKGKVEDVHQMKQELFEKMIKISTTVPLFSNDAPKRGTMEFLKHACKCEDDFPPSWTLKRKDFDNGKGSQQKSQLHPVDQRVYQAIEKVVINTCKQNLAGRGADALGIPLNSTVKVIKVERVENPTLFMSYEGKRKNIMREVLQKNQLCQEVGQLTNSKGPVEIMQHLDDAMKKELLYEINELYFFHGTKQGILKSICEQGLDCRLSSSSAMFGQGVYTAESSTKADQYADDRGNRLPNGSKLYMFLTRVALGDVFLCDDNHESVQARDSPKLKRPPCCSCLKDICACTGVGHYHSVMGNGKWIFREFVVYEKDQCYPEYLITYQRV